MAQANGKFETRNVKSIWSFFVHDQYMRAGFLIRVGAIAVVASCFFGSRFFLSEDLVSNAQSSNSEYRKLLERDKNVPKEKVEKAFAEAKKIQDDIVAAMAKLEPKFALGRTYARQLIYDIPGQRGSTSNEIIWQNDKTNLLLRFELGLNKEDTLRLFRRGLESIAMGDFIDVPGIGEEATLVKNVTANTKMTSVGIHFVKGRAQMHIYLRNGLRSTAKNEKELMEIVRIIEPLVVARASFDEP
jgi:hypothetical protein